MYKKPMIKTISPSNIIECLGPTQAGYGEFVYKQIGPVTYNKTIDLNNNIAIVQLKKIEDVRTA